MELHEALQKAGDGGRATREMNDKRKRFLMAYKEDHVAIYEHGKGYIREAKLKEYSGFTDWIPRGERGSNGKRN
jgi:hypothetical protein